MPHAFPNQGPDGVGMESKKYTVENSGSLWGHTARHTCPARCIYTPSLVDLFYETILIDPQRERNKHGHQEDKGEWVN